MEWLRELAPGLREWAPLAATLGIVALALMIAELSLQRRERRTGRRPTVGRQLVMLAATAVGISAVVLTLPLSESLRGRLLGLLGLVFTGVIGFSSTTFVANAMAGLMLRAVRNFRPGDWIRVGAEFGRVTERGLFHTEIQTEDRDLATLPNLYLVQQPVTVVRASGTVVGADLSLGYDLDRATVEPLLIRAAESSGLRNAFVRVLELGNFSVTYRVAGILDDVGQLLSARSKLRGSVLDTLHAANVEIVSPSFMNQRRIDAAKRFIPPARAAATPPREPPPPEALIFDKADQKATLEALRIDRERLLAEIANLEKSAAEADPAERERVAAAIERLRARADRIAGELAAESEREQAEETS